MQQAEQFESWVILELMGRVVIAGKMTERVVAGTGFIHITIPATTRQPEFSRLISPSAVYAINPVSEELARYRAEQLNEAPVQAYEVASFIKKNPQIQIGSHTESAGEEQEDDGYSDEDYDQ